MKSRTKELTDRATAAMAAAIEVYNKPIFPYRGESFAILTINGWELLLKAKWLTLHQNKEASVYVREFRRNSNGSRSKKSYIRKTRSGAPYTYSLDHLARQLVGLNALDPSAHRNIEVMLEFRDCAVHFIAGLRSSGHVCTRLARLASRTSLLLCTIGSDENFPNLTYT